MGFLLFKGDKKNLDILEIEKTFENKKRQFWINFQISIFIEIYDTLKKIKKIKKSPSHFLWFFFHISQSTK